MVRSGKCFPTRRFLLAGGPGGVLHVVETPLLIVRLRNDLRNVKRCLPCLSTATKVQISGSYMPSSAGRCSFPTQTFTPASIDVRNARFTDDFRMSKSPTACTGEMKSM